MYIICTTVCYVCDKGVFGRRRKKSNAGQTIILYLGQLYISDNIIHRGADKNKVCVAGRIPYIIYIRHTTYIIIILYPPKIGRVLGYNII